MKKEEKFDGVIDGKKVKVIVRENKKGEKHYFAKPKNKDTPTPHFVEVGNILKAHQDSDNGMDYRSMSPIIIGSGCYPSGNFFVDSSGNDLLFLPMQENSDGFVINTTPSGDEVTLPKDSWCLKVEGKLGYLQAKGKHLNF